MLSGRGHHLAWRIGSASSPFRRLCRLGRDSFIPEQAYSPADTPDGFKVDPRFQSAYSGLGRVMEFLCFETIRKADLSGIPVQLTEIIPQPYEKGREMISLDLTEYGDPLHTRIVRLPFSVYRKPWVRHHVLEESITDRIPLLFAVPSDGRRNDSDPAIRTEPRLIIRAAETGSGCIPSCCRGTDLLIDHYLASEVRKCHQQFYSEAQEDPGNWPDTYDRFKPEALPPCAAEILVHPNDLLLKPTLIRHLVRLLLALKWHPRHIAGLIRSRYERDYGWANRWYIYNAADRADFFVRVFYDSILLGTDTLADFTCACMQEKTCCPSPADCCSLEQFRHVLRKEKPSL
jgi:hypothetical protein